MSYPTFSQSARPLSEKMENRTAAVALLLHADYCQSALLTQLMPLLHPYGKLTIKRIYGHSSSFAHQWDAECLKTYGLHALPQLDNNAAMMSSVLLLDAMELLEQQAVDTLVLCANDPLQSALVHRARARGVQVIGFGTEKAQGFANACDVYFTLDNAATRHQESALTRPTPERTTELFAKPQEPVHATPNNLATPKPEVRAPEPRMPVEPRVIVEPEEPHNNMNSNINNNRRMIRSLPTRTMVYKAVRDCAEPDGWTLTTKLGSYMRYLQPNFDYKLLGYLKLSDFLRAIPGLQFRYESPTRLFCRKIDYAPLLNLLEQAMQEYRGSDGWADIDDVADFVEEEWSYSEYGFDSFRSLLDTVVGAEVDDVNHLMRYTRTTRYTT